MDLNTESWKKYKLLPDQAKNAFVARHELEKKKPWVFYVLLFLLGQFGAHKFYLNRSGFGWVYIMLTILPLFLRSLLEISLIAKLVLIIFDLVTGVSQVRKWNEKYFEYIIDSYYDSYKNEPQSIASNISSIDSDDNIPNIGLL